MALVLGVGPIGRCIGKVCVGCESHLFGEAQWFCDWEFLGFLACRVGCVGKDLGEFFEEADLGRWEVSDQMIWAFVSECVPHVFSGCS